MVAGCKGCKGCKGDTHFLHLLHPSARIAPFCQELHPSARIAPFCQNCTLPKKGQPDGDHITSSTNCGPDALGRGGPEVARARRARHRAPSRALAGGGIGNIGASNRNAAQPGSDSDRSATQPSGRTIFGARIRAEPISSSLTARSVSCPTRPPRCCPRWRVGPAASLRCFLIERSVPSALSRFLLSALSGGGDELPPRAAGRFH